MKPRREEPLCAQGFELSNGKCMRVTDVTDVDTVLSQCWSGRPILSEQLTPHNLAKWLTIAREGIQKTRSSISKSDQSSIWIPLRRLQKQTPLQMPSWIWSAGDIFD